MTVSDGCYAQVLEGGSPALYRVRVEEQEARSSDRLRRRLPGRLRRGALRRALAGRLPALRRRLRRRVDPALRRRHLRAGEGRPAARTRSRPSGSRSARRSAERLLRRSPTVRDRRRGAGTPLLASMVRWLPPSIALPRTPIARSGCRPRALYDAAMEVEIGRGKKARRAYGFDDIAIVPSRRTRDPDDVDISWTLGPYRFELPLLAAALDGVVSPRRPG